ncbi:MAG: DUF6531 domain-containing protein, partial [Fimbriimonadales bacterium]|nr:DUF6531 domain-containing protein [Fimbriimonadales bacterium]
MSSFGFRVFTLALAVFFFFETAIAGVKSASIYVENDSAGGKRSGILKPGIGGKSPALQGGNKRIRIPLAPYKFRNQKHKPVLNPSRDPVTRGGMWSQQNLKDWADLQKRKSLSSGRTLLFNLYLPSRMFIGNPSGLFSHSVVQVGGPPGTGRNPWELGGSGGGPGMGGMGSSAPGTGNVPNGAGAGAFAEVNTHTGNHLFTVPLFGWTQRGGMGVGITLYHNSMNNENGPFGRGWTWSYGMKVEESGSSAFVYWPDGLIVPYEYDSQSQSYNSPPGNHDT